MTSSAGANPSHAWNATFEFIEWKKPFPICQQIATLIFFPSWLLVRQMAAHARTVDGNKFPRRRLVRAKVHISCFCAAYGKRKSHDWRKIFVRFQEWTNWAWNSKFFSVRHVAHAKSLRQKKKSHKKLQTIRYTQKLRLTSWFTSKRKYSDQIFHLPTLRNQSLCRMNSIEARHRITSNADEWESHKLDWLEFVKFEFQMPWQHEVN